MNSIDQEINEINIEEKLTEINDQIDKLLGKIEDSSLRRYHASVDISFRQMFDYISSISGSDVPKEFGVLVNAYREMAQLFYAQYELLLLKEIEKQRKVHEDVELTFDKIDIKLDGENEEVKDAKKTITELLDESVKSANVKYEKLIEEFPELLQSALDKLRDEWQRINTIVSAGQELNQEEELFRSLKSVVAVAAHSVGVGAERIVIVPGDVFALYFFTYLENFAVLTIPIYSMQASWEWSIIWHELAGYKVRWLEKNGVVETIRQRLEKHYIYYNAEDEESKKNLLNSLAPDNQFSQNYLEKLFSGDELILDALGSFEYQFEQLMAKLPSKNRIHEYQKLKKAGWCVDWLKELFEDAWSVLAFGELFKDIFEDILYRNAARDERHPPVEVRVNVAEELMALIDDEKGVYRRPREINKIAAKKILEFITLLIASARNFEPQENGQITSQQVLRQESQDIRDEISATLREVIQNSIIDWSEKILETDDPEGNAKKRSKDFVAKLSNATIANLIDKLDEKVKEQINKKYINILQYEDYRMLLEYPFYEVDFGTATVTDVYYGTRYVFDTAKLSSVPLNVTGGNIRYVDSSGTKRTTIQSWNTAAAPGYKIN